MTGLGRTGVVGLIRGKGDEAMVRGRLDLTELVPPQLPGPEAVLNGIAYDPEANRLLVTGKLWPRLFEIRGKETAVSFGEQGRKVFVMKVLGGTVPE